MSVNSGKALPPVEKWNPAPSGNIDIEIKRNGIWLHEGDEIKRHELVKLFASILKKEGDDYFLVTPVEKWQIQVEDVPFHVVDMEVANYRGQQALVFQTLTGDSVVLSRDNPLRVETDPANEEPSPYLLIRNGMEGLINRNTFYRLVEFTEPFVEGDSSGYRIISLGEYFQLG